MLEKIEIERKFLLKNLPNDIDKISLKDRSIERYYSTADEKVSKEDDKYLLIRKQEIDEQLVRKELTHEINKEDFDAFLETKAKKRVFKLRYFINDEYGQSWQIDDFVNIKLIMAECEILVNPDEQEKGEKMMNKIILPDFIKNHLIGEVTGNEDFANYNLALDYD